MPSAGGRGASSPARAPRRTFWTLRPAPPPPPPLAAARDVSSLQFLLQLLEEPPVSTLRDQALRRRLDHPRLAEAEGIEADGVLRIVDAPLVVRNILHGLERIVVARREAAVDEGPSGPLRLEGADVGRLQDRPQRPLGRDRMFADELPVTRGEAAKVL